MQQISLQPIEFPSFIEKNPKLKKSLNIFFQEAIHSSLNNFVPLPKKIQKKAIKNIDNLKDFISFIEIIFKTAIEKKVISARMAELKKIDVFESLAQNIKEFSSLEVKQFSPAFKAVVFSQNLKNMIEYFLNTEDSQRLEILKQIIKIDRNQYFFMIWPILNLNPEESYELLETLNEEKPHEFIEFISDYSFSDCFPLLNNDDKLKLLKKNKALNSENCTTLIQILDFNKDQTKEIVKFLLFLYPEEMLYKIDNLSCFTSLEKLNLYFDVISFFPRLINIWKAVFKLSTRKELKEKSHLINILTAYDSTTKPAEVEKLERELKLLNQDTIPSTPSLRKSLFIWVGFVLDNIELYGKKNNLLTIVQTLIHYPDSFRYPMATLMIKNDFNSNFDLFHWAYELAGIDKRLWLQLTSDQNQFILSAINMIDSVLYSFETKQRLLNELITSDSGEQLFLKAHALYSLLSLNNPKMFDEKIPVNNLFNVVFQSLIKTDQFNLLSLYAHTFGSFRIPEALMVYAKNLQLIRFQADKALVLESLKELVLDVFSGDFIKKRYSPDLSSHLKAINPIVLDEWQKNEIKIFEHEYIIYETDEIGDLFLCTTEVSGSCLSIRGDPEDAKSLLAYLEDGKNKLICIKDSTGVMIGRAIMRLLIDDQNDPVILLDTFFCSVPYDDSDDSLFKILENSVLRVAELKARQMKSPLLKTYSDSDVVYPRAIYSLGGRAPFECCNTVGASGNDEHCKDSKFMIPKTSWITMDDMDI